MTTAPSTTITVPWPVRSVATPDHQVRADILAEALDSDWQRMAGEYLADFERIAPREVVAFNIHAHGLYEAALAGRWGHVANTLFNLVEAAEEYYANR